MMTQNTFEVKVEPDSTEHIIQAIDEADKNHGPDDTEKNNQAKMYATNSKYTPNES